MSSNPIRNPPGRPRKWRGHRSLVRLYFQNVRRDEPLLARGVVRAIHERDDAHPNINPSRMATALKAHMARGGRGIDIVPYPQKHCVIYVRKDSNLTK